MVILERLANKHPERLPRQLGQFEEFYGDMNYFPYDMNITVHDGSVMRWISARGAPARPTNAVLHTSDGGKIHALFNFTGPSQIDAGMNVLLISVIILLMLCFSLVLSNSVSAIVLRPLEKLLQQVRKMASTIFKSVTDMAQTMREDKESEDGREDEEDYEDVGG